MLQEFKDDRGGIVNLIGFQISSFWKEEWVVNLDVWKGRSIGKDGEVGIGEAYLRDDKVFWQVYEKQDWIYDCKFIKIRREGVYRDIYLWLLLEFQIRDVLMSIFWFQILSFIQQIDMI